MRARVAENVMRSGRFGRRVRLRVDLHGVSVFGPGSRRTLIRWEWVTAVEGGHDDVLVRGSSGEVRFPAGAFGLAPEELRALLLEARSIERRPDVIGRLAAAAAS